jgi:hypothetical protein
MKKLGIIAMLSLMAIVTFGQDVNQKKTPEQKAELKLERMTKKLDLSETQVASIKAIQSKRMSEHKELQAKHKAIHAKIDTHKMESVSAVRLQLTDAQQIQFDEIQAKRVAKHEKMKAEVKAFKQEQRKK